MKCLWGVLVMLSLGCSSSSVIEQAKLLGAKKFTQETWAVASQEQRGEMVFSFLAEHDPKSLSSNSVKELLGNPTGYYDYDENPAYFVGSRSVESEYGKGYLLVFITDKTSGKITTVKIIPEPNERSGT